MSRPKWPPSEVSKINSKTASRKWQLLSTPPCSQIFWSTTEIGVWGHLPPQLWSRSLREATLVCSTLPRSLRESGTQVINKEWQCQEELQRSSIPTLSCQLHKAHVPCAWASVARGLSLPADGRCSGQTLSWCLCCKVPSNLQEINKTRHKHKRIKWLSLTSWV